MPLPPLIGIAWNKVYCPSFNRKSKTGAEDSIFSNLEFNSVLFRPLIFFSSGIVNVAEKVSLKELDRTLTITTSSGYLTGGTCADTVLKIFRNNKRATILKAFIIIYLINFFPCYTVSPEAPSSSVVPAIPPATTPTPHPTGPPINPPISIPAAPPVRAPKISLATVFNHFGILILKKLTSNCGFSLSWVVRTSNLF
jgi:hypothetical protein